MKDKRIGMAASPLRYDGVGEGTWVDPRIVEEIIAARELHGASKPVEAYIAKADTPLLAEHSTTTTEPFKYREAEILDELKEYLRSTYGQHYVGKNNIQANDLVLAGDRTEARGFWKWNAIKYLLRYGKKKGTNKADLLKALHYTILLVYLDFHNGEGE